MKITEERIDDEQLMLKVTMTDKEMVDQIKTASLVIAQQNGIKPEKGKLPIDLLVDRFGNIVAGNLLKDYIMNSLAPRIFQERGVSTIGAPTITSNEIPQIGRDFNFEIVAVQKPEFELSSYEPVEVRIPETPVSDAEIDILMKEKIKGYQSYETDTTHDLVTPRDTVELAMETKIGNKPVSGLTTDGRPYVIGIGDMPPAFDRALIGVKVGDSKTIEYEAPDYNLAAHQGDEIVMDTYVSNVTIKRILIEAESSHINDEWVAEHIEGVDTLEQWRAELRKEILGVLDENKHHLINQATSAELAKRLVGTISDAVYKAYIQEMQQELMMRLRQEGISRQDFLQQQGMDEQQYNMGLMIQARERLSQMFAMDALARHLKLTVTEKDLKQFFEYIAPGNEDMARMSFERSGRMAEAKESTLLMKANDWLTSHSKIIEG